MNNMYLPNERYSLPTEDEQVVNEMLLGDCPHRDTGASEVQPGEWQAFCRDCGIALDVPGHGRGRPTAEDLRVLFLRSQLRPARCKLNAYPVQYRLQYAGWSITYMTINGATRCTLEKGGRIIRSEPQPDEPASLIQAAARACLQSVSVCM